MMLTLEETELFRKLHRSLLVFVNQKLQLVPGGDTPDQFAALPPEQQIQVRDALLGQTDLIASFVESNPFDLTHEECAIVASWKDLVAGDFFVFRFLKKHAIFLAISAAPTAYGVLAWNVPLETLLGPRLPVMVKAVLLPFRGAIVHDGLIRMHVVSFGPGVRRRLDDDYREAKQRLGVVTALPIGAQPLPAPATKAKTSGKTSGKTSAKTSAKTARGASKGAGDVLKAIIDLTDPFCREHLNEEYAALCRKLAEKLARKRPSPLLQGRTNTWACGIVRALGTVNFLEDRSQRPYLKMTAVDKAFGVSQSTGQAKSLQIRKMLKMGHFDHNWMLPSQLENSPMTWMVTIDGFIMDIRQCPRHIQEVAYRKGLIPYIPADR